MPAALPYGLTASLALDLSADALVAYCAAPHGESLPDTAAAVAAALANPLEFPALSKATVPGDRIVVTVENELPQTAELVSAVARYLTESGTAPDALTVLCPESSAFDGDHDPRRLLPDTWREQVACEVHDSADTARLGLLGSTHGGEGVYINRTLLDADLVIPIGCLRCEPTIGFHGQHGGLFPTFSNDKTLTRFRKPHTVDHEGEYERRARREIDEVGWMLGVQCTVQVVPGAGESLLDVLAGELHQVYEAGQKRCQAAWNFTVPRRASLVVAAISGGPGQQTWDNLGRALAAAAAIVTDGGAIAICTELATEPGPAVSILAQADDMTDAERQIRRACPRDALSAVALARVIDRAKVYLLSRLDESSVADLGVAPVSNAGEIARLARRHASCTILANAQHARPTALED
jgi:nickel-dependent lactate racemase